MYNQYEGLACQQITPALQEGAHPPPTAHTHLQTVELTGGANEVTTCHDQAGDRPGCQNPAKPAKKMPSARRRMARIEIACNDPDNGMFDGKARRIQIGATEFDCLTLDWAPRLTVAEGDGWIRVGGKKIRCVGSKNGVGNWCWNAYYCDAGDVEALINWPKFRKWFAITSAPVGVWARWDDGKPLRFKRAGGSQ